MSSPTACVTVLNRLLRKPGTGPWACDCEKPEPKTLTLKIPWALKILNLESCGLIDMGFKN